MARRMDKLESNHDSLRQEVSGLKSTVERVELNQKHAEEVNALHFAALNTGLTTMSGKFDAFVTRIDGIIAGEIQTAQSQQGQKILAEYLEWRKSVELEMEESRDFRTQTKTIGNIIKLLVAGNTIAIIAGVAAILK